MKIQLVEEKDEEMRSRRGARGCLVAALFVAPS
jgi:hypothetical protein